VDLATVSGAPVRAAGAGTVYFAGWVAGRPVVSVSHADGLRTTYEPVRPVVRTGDRLAAGDRLGVLLPGHPGCPVARAGASGSDPAAGSGGVDPTHGPACLHWGLRRGMDYLDPLALLAHGRVRLFPTGSSQPAAHPRSGTAGEESRQPPGEAVVLIGAVVDLSR
jgi:murein DD-endopeptidase MepM/ murein hydrolase activator NlpD